MPGFCSESSVLPLLKTLLANDSMNESDQVLTGPLFNLLGGRRIHSHGGGDRWQTQDFCMH